MNKQQLHQVTESLANNLVGEETNIWPAVKNAAAKIDHYAIERHDMKKPFLNQKAFRTSAIALAILAVFAVLLFFTPQGRVLAQEINNLFHKASGDTLPAETLDITPVPTDQTATPDPASILDAHSSVDEVAAMAGFKVYQPASIPEGFAFSGGSFDPKTSIARLFYQSVESNGIVLKQQPIGTGDTCDLCGEVGASAEIQEVSINGVRGEYVVGVWKLTDEGAVWNSDPYLQTLRWQQDGFAFELMYMGSPDALTKDQMVAIASSLQ
jgi:hypothetical protein